MYTFSACARTVDLHLCDITPSRTYTPVALFHNELKKGLHNMIFLGGTNLTLT
jgi:hypothetical protein